MKNITVSVPDDVYLAARIRAAELDTSVSALVTEHLVNLSRREADFKRLSARQHRILGQIQRFSAADRLDRDEVHDRALR